jgi:translation initiation factor 2 beta subunit (eIF-2beta)/eIF-5
VDSDSIEKDEDGDESSNIGRRNRKPKLERHDGNEDSYSNSGDISDISRDDISSESHEQLSTCKCDL